MSSHEMLKQEALAKIFAELNAMSPEELRAKIDEYKNGPLTIALKEAQEFLHGEE